MDFDEKMELLISPARFMTKNSKIKTVRVAGQIATVTILLPWTVTAFVGMMFVGFIVVTLDDACGWLAAWWREA